MYALYVYPVNKHFKPHFWEQLCETKEQAETAHSQLIETTDWYDPRKLAYYKVEIKIAPFELEFPEIESKARELAERVGDWINSIKIETTCPYFRQGLLEQVIKQLNQSV
jgi:hypothetical protein